MNLDSIKTLFLHDTDIEKDIKSLALSNIIDIANSEHKDSFNANRYLLTSPWKDTNTKGAPSREDINRNAKEIIALEEELIKAMERING